MGHLAASGSRRDESPWQKAEEEERDAADAHENSRSSRASNRASLRIRPTSRPREIGGTYVVDSSAVKALAGLLG